MQVESMSTAELQQQLQARNISTQGLTKFDLQDSLWASLQAEAGLLPAEDAAVSRHHLYLSSSALFSCYIECLLGMQYAGHAICDEIS